MVSSQGLPVASSVPLLEAVGLGEGMLRVRFAAPSAEPACSYMAVYLRTVGTAAWTTVSCDTRRLVESGKKGNSFPVNAGGVVVEGLCAGSWEAQVCAMNCVGWGATSLVSDAVAVLGPKVPPAPSAPLLEAVGEGKLRVRFAAPLAKSPCSQMAVYLRVVGTVAWGTVNGLTKRLDEIEKGRKSVPARAGSVVVEGLSAGPWESKVAAMNVVGWGVDSPVSSHVSVATDDDDVAIVGSQSWADRDRELRKGAIDIDAEPQETEEGRKRHRSKMPPAKPPKRTYKL